MQRVRTYVSSSIAIVVGIILLLGYFVPNELLQGLRTNLLETAMLLAAIALIIGALNLLKVHVQRAKEESIHAFYSFWLVLAFAAMLIATLVQGPFGEIPMWVFTHIQVPVETSLMAVLAATLTFTALRLVHRHTNSFVLLFLFFSFVSLLLSSPYIGYKIPFLYNTFKPLMLRLVASSGARGILLGVALGIVATGIRILIGAERPYTDQDHE